MENPGAVRSRYLRWWWVASGLVLVALVAHQVWGSGEAGVTIGGKSCGVLTCSASTYHLGIVDAATGFEIAGAATSGRYLKGDGTNFVQSSGAASGTGACAANQWASTLNADSAPTCTQPAFSNLSGTTTTAQVPLMATFIHTAFGGL